MNTTHDNARDMLRCHMNGALDRVIANLHALDALAKMSAGGYATQDDWDALGGGVQDTLWGLGVERDERGDWDADAAEQQLIDDLDPLAITYEKGKPFDVALTIGGPNIYLVDFGGHGGAQLRGAWGSGWETITGPNVTRAVEFYREQAREAFGD